VKALDHLRLPPAILVVEDEMLLRMRAVDMVEDASYVPVEAVDADQAILPFRSDIALRFTDIQMLGSMSGLELALAVAGRWPRIKIILASGQLKLSQSEIPESSRFFGKSLDSVEMIAEIRGMLGHA
jgi:DNA-binding NtrC family response regulator